MTLLTGCWRLPLKTGSDTDIMPVSRELLPLDLLRTGKHKNNFFKQEAHEWAIGSKQDSGHQLSR